MPTAFSSLFFLTLCSCLPKAQQKMIVDVTCYYVFLCSLYPCHSWIFKWVAWAVRDQSEFNLRIIFSWEPSAGLTYMDKVALLVSRGLWGGEDTGRHCAIASIFFLSPPPPPFSAPPRLTLEDGRDKIVLTSFFGYIIDGLIIFGQNCRF